MNCSAHSVTFLYFAHGLLNFLLVFRQVAATTRKIPNSRIPNYPNLPSQLLCQVHSITMHVSLHASGSGFRCTSRGGMMHYIAPDPDVLVEVQVQVQM
jgi:hypothetical protein